jgi:ribosomal protein L37AE/L43A
MYRKNCEKCNRPSYSSSEFGEWHCPICGNDLTQQPFFDAITFERIYINKLSITKKLQYYQKQENPNCQ